MTFIVMPAVPIWLRCIGGLLCCWKRFLRQKGLWESSVSDFQSQNPRGFTYGSPNQAYVGLYFHSMEAQQTLEEDRLESWELVLQESTPRYGGLMEKCRGLTNLYRLIVAK